MAKLGVNIDHVATIRQARREDEPDPIWAAKICERAGADSIVAHLREDRRHIHDHDVKTLRQVVTTRFNLEMSINKGIVDIAVKLKPDQATLVPEKRQEITTEGGLDVVKHFTKVKNVTRRLQEKGIQVSLFIDPVKKQIEKSKELGADSIELHTGTYALAKTRAQIAKELNKLKSMTQCAQEIGLIVNAGHGLKYNNVKPIARMRGINELNIGHSIISRSVFVGLAMAVKEMNELIKGN